MVSLTSSLGSEGRPLSSSPDPEQELNRSRSTIQQLEVMSTLVVISFRYCGEGEDPIRAR
jgi:hypothetical protein